MRKKTPLKPEDMVGRQVEYMQAIRTPKPSFKKAPKKQKTLEERFEEIKNKYPNHTFTDGSMLLDVDNRKYSVEIECQHPGCSAKRRVFTPDLFQVRYCDVHKKLNRKKAK